MVIFLQMVLDTLLIFLCCELLFRKSGDTKRKDLLLLPVFFLFCIAARVSFNTGQTQNILFLTHGFEISPADNVFVLLFWILAVLLVNSVYYKPETNDYSFFGTMAAFSLYLLLRVCSVMLFSFCGAVGDLLFLGSRVLSVLFVCVMRPFSDYLREAVASGSLIAKLVSVNIAVVLSVVLSMQSFDYRRFAAQRWKIAVALLTLVGINGILIAVNQRKEQEKKHIRMIEQYVPIVEELVSQVRSRQHEFNNRLFAIEAAVSSAASLEEAQQAVARLKSGMVLEGSDKELLGCDSKIIAGLLYEKVNYAKTLGIKIQLELRGAFKKTLTPETEWIEILGILADNAMEASKAGDVIFIKSRQLEMGLELTVENPAPPISNSEFMTFFRRGVTTKADKSGHGFGLYNVSRIVERRHGKILTKNVSVDGKNHVVFGVLLP